MELNKLYDIAYRENIPIINFKMKNKAIIGRVDNEYCIGLNYSKIEGIIEEKELLAEELGHYYCDSFYNSSSPLSVISKKEYRAKKWKCNILISVTDFNYAFSKGAKTIYEIAEYFGLSEDTVAFAYNYYKENSYI